MKDTMTAKTAFTDDFVEFPKLHRLSRECLITEKIDGTSGQIWISDCGTTMRCGSRNRWLTVDADNFGFARWATEHADELYKLGPGRHFGEWWGQGIQRGYGLKEKRFSLFNVIRWCAHDATPAQIPSNDPKAPVKLQDRLPACCSLVPTLWRGIFDTGHVDTALEILKNSGSQAAKGFMNPEGVVVFHIASNVGFKKTILKDETPKSLVR